MKHHVITLGSEQMELHGEKLVWIPALKLLCASDIHFEKASFFRRFATFLPPYDTEETLSALEQAMAHFRPDIFIALGDSFHDAGAAERLEPATHNRLVTLTGNVRRWIWVTGNHDPAISNRIPGERCEDITFDGIAFRHQALTGSHQPEISGHYHPKATFKRMNSRISSACFVHSREKLIMPSFGHFTGGMSIDNTEFLNIIPAAGRRIFLAYEGNIYGL